tara:strand:+ start:170 stop:409 length:240 start_codon:yes stop_codon:yes gene_type:complete
MKLNKNDYKNCEWKNYTCEIVYRWTVTATSKQSALGMIDNEIENPKWVEDGDEIKKTRIDIIKVNDEYNYKTIYEKEVA